MQVTKVSGCYYFTWLLHCTSHAFKTQGTILDQNQKNLGKSPSPPSCNSSINPCLGGQVGKETETSKVLQAVDLKADLPLAPPTSVECPLETFWNTVN